MITSRAYVVRDAGESMPCPAPAALDKRRCTKTYHSESSCKICVCQTAGFSAPYMRCYACTQKHVSFPVIWPHTVYHRRVYAIARYVWAVYSTQDTKCAYLGRVVHAVRRQTGTMQAQHSWVGFNQAQVMQVVIHTSVRDMLEPEKDLCWVGGDAHRSHWI